MRLRPVLWMHLLAGNAAITRFFGKRLRTEETTGHRSLSALTSSAESKRSRNACFYFPDQAGLGRNRVQRYKCQQCGKRFSEPRQKPFDSDVPLPQETVCRILHCLVEGNSVRGTARLCDVEKRNGTLRQLCKRLTRLTYAFSSIMGQPPSCAGTPLCILQSVTGFKDHSA
jgi:transposase-like protein